MKYTPYKRTDGKFDIIADDIDERDYLHIGLSDEETTKIVCEKLEQAYEKGYDTGHGHGYSNGVSQG